jgi:integrase
MPVRTETRRGRRILVIDIPYRKVDGTWDRYRRDSVAPGKAGAIEEERRIRDRIARTGSPYETPAPSNLESPGVAGPLFAEIAKTFLSEYAPSALKVSTRTRYEKLIRNVLVPRFGTTPITSIDAAAVRAFDAELAEKTSRRKGQLRRATRNNVQIALRSVLRYAVESENLGAMPSLPPLKRIGRSVLRVMTDTNVEAILGATTHASHRIAFMLAAFAGLRANEVRGLRWRDVTLTTTNGKTTGELVVRRGIVRGIADTPKSGHERVVPLLPRLAEALAAVKRRGPDQPVTTTVRGDAWGDFGLGQAFERSRDRAGVPDTFTFHSLRHYFVTSWLMKGVPAHVVQQLAGHEHLATTQRYAHVTESDLRTAAARVAGNMLETASPGTPSDRS